MTEGTNKDGGYTVPEDISTQVKNYREEFFDMTQYVNVEKVSTKSGARTYQKKKTVTGFQVVGEGTAIPGLAQPEFERIAFTIAKYAGIIPVTRELLSDSDANIVRIIMRWFGRNSAVTRNNLIFNIIKAKTQVFIVSSLIMPAAIAYMDHLRFLLQSCLVLLPSHVVLLSAVAMTLHLGLLQRVPTCSTSGITTMLLIRRRILQQQLVFS